MGITWDCARFGRDAPLPPGLDAEPEALAATGDRQALVVYARWHPPQRRPHDDPKGVPSLIA